MNAILSGISAFSALPEDQHSQACRTGLKNIGELKTAMSPI